MCQYNVIQTSSEEISQQPLKKKQGLFSLDFDEEEKIDYDMPKIIETDIKELDSPVQMPKYK